MERKNFDVCVEGAGPAGAAAACRLAERGIDAILVDRARFPRDKVCGDGVGPRMARALARLIIGDLSRTAFLDARNWGKLWRAWRQK